MTSKQNYKGKIIRYSGYLIKNENEPGFCPEKYSKFKHGSNNIAREFGYELADRFINECFSKEYAGEQIVILPSAYSYIPTASFFMKKHFMDKLNLYLYENNYPIVEETKIHRSVTYREDYGEMSAEQRYKLISGDKFHVDKDYLKNKVLLHLDDIKITGTHEHIIVNMLNEHNITNDCYMLCYAELTNKEIAPSFENYLNNYFVKSLNDVDTIIREDDFVFNTRVVKLILNKPASEFDSFIQKREPGFIRDLYHNAINNEYFKFASYSRNLNELKKVI